MTAGTGRHVPSAPPTRPLRVAHWLHALEIGGTELNAVRTLERLDRTRFEPVLYTLRLEGPLVRRITDLGIRVREFRVGSLRGPRLPRMLLAAARAMRADGIDVVHCHDRYANVFGALAARLAGRRAVITSKRLWVWPRPFGAANALAFRLSARVLANSESVAETLRRNDGVPPGRVVVVSNFLDDAAFADWPASRVATERAALGVPADAVVVGIVARLAEVKHHELLLRAAARLRARWPHLHVVLVGEGPREEGLRRLALELAIEPAVHFAGYRPQHPNPHRLFDISVLCSHHEGFPNSVVEAMAAARPVVATAVGGVPDAVVDGRTGHLVPAGNVIAFADALDALLADAPRRAAFGQAGAALAHERYHADTIVPRLEQLYEQLAAG